VGIASDSGSTTVTEASCARGSSGHSDLSLVWLFPRPNVPPVELSWQGDGELEIGRDEACPIRLSGNDVSRRHAALCRSGPERGLSIRDLGSRNGVRVNGRAVSSAPLVAGDVLRLGGWVGVLTAAPGPFREIAPGLLGGRILDQSLASLRKAAESDLPVVLEGETGTGKEVVTRSLHGWSGRPGPLLAVNCATLPDALAEAELFGYRRGAFTGADRPSPGFFRSAEGGTLLLDEVSDLPLALQAKLLRVLEQREVQPLGEARPVPIDVRIIVAGQQSLAEAVQRGRFRADLLARLDGLTVRLPPLRKRREDVPPLFSHFLRELSHERAPAVESDLIERLCAHDWPFNVRELVLLVRRLLVLHEGASTLTAEHLPERMLNAEPSLNRDSEAQRGAQPPAKSESIDLPALITALRASGGNVARASAALGITRQRAYRLMEGKAIDLEALREAEEPRQ
jgi:sigma-54 dependent transcriptional regulator, acetoin dehydrogenase operon transcriptional activator AcoR